MSISTKIKAEIIEEKVNNPEASYRAIAATVGKNNKTTINHNTIKNVLDAYINADLIKVPTVYDTLQANDNIISLGKKKLEESFGLIGAKGKHALKVEKFQDLKTISDIIDTAFKQNQLIKGNSTENLGVGLQLSDAQKQMIAAKYFDSRKVIQLDEPAYEEPLSDNNDEQECE